MSVALAGVLVHGGAGSVALPRRDDHVAGCVRAARAGVAVLRAGGSALDAAARAVEVLEDDPRYNAGRGACLTRDGTVELDACIADGAGLGYGAVCALPPFRNPIAIARAVLREGRHVLYAGAGAKAFAEAQGFVAVDDDALVTAVARARWTEVRAGRAEAGYPGGTVGAVAFDGHNVAAATSTGGMMDKARGRVGDSPIPGAGTAADNLRGAVSVTGHGERVLQVGLGWYVLGRMEAGTDAMRAADEAIAYLAARVAGTGGLIVLDRNGHPGWAHNTETMSRAYARVDGFVDAGI